MNAHISHDLPLAVVDACVELGKAPLDESPEHHDFTRTNDVLAVAQEEIKGWFSTGVIATVDQLGGRVDDGFAAFGIHLARAGAWQTSEVLWELSANERLDRIFRQGLARSVEMASRGILLYQQASRPAHGTDVPAPRARTSAARRACGTTRPGGAPSSRVRRPAAPRSARPPGR